jgi:hypothetical protein
MEKKRGVHPMVPDKSRDDEGFISWSRRHDRPLPGRVSRKPSLQPGERALPAAIRHQIASADTRPGVLDGEILIPNWRKSADVVQVTSPMPAHSKTITGRIFPAFAVRNHRKMGEKLQMRRDNDRFLPKSV